MAGKAAVALLHYPVYDKNKQVVSTSVTNLDIHDIARAAKTFGLARYFVITPVEGQQSMVSRILSHWTEGWGATYNAKRKDALELITLANSIEEAGRSLEAEFGCAPRIVFTGARPRENTISSVALQQVMRTDPAPFLIVFGTGWGITDEMFAQADFILEPIAGPGEYNHLSVRSAVAIYLDRLFSRTND